MKFKFNNMLRELIEKKRENTKDKQYFFQFSQQVLHVVQQHIVPSFTLFLLAVIRQVKE